jgi:carbonic anhydrase
MKNSALKETENNGVNEQNVAKNQSPQINIHTCWDSRRTELPIIVSQSLSLENGIYIPS